MTKFEKGEIDLLELTTDSFRALMVDADHVREDLAEKGVQIGKEDSLLSFYVIFNVKDPLLQNKTLRQAIASAIDRNQWMDAFEKDRSVIQDQVSPPGLLDRVVNSRVKFDFNLERAKSLLAKAGYPEGKGLPVINLDFRGADVRYRQMGEMFVQQLGAIGVKIKPILNPFLAYREKARQGNTQLSLGGWTYDYPDVENGFQLLYGPNRAPGPNDSLWENPQFDSLYRKFSTLAAGAPGRKELIKQAEAVVQEEVPWAYGYFLKTYRLSQKRVKNFRVAEVIQNKYKYLRLDRESDPH
jgi:ABC-type transport system substrate-binding protein